MMKIKSKFFLFFIFAGFINFSLAAIDQSKGSFEDKFRQLDEVFPSPNLSRPATGEPGPMYWQQRADYKIQIKLYEDTRSVEGSETITYTNNSPLTLKYIWLQLDQNIFAKESINNLTRPWGGGDSSVDFSTLRRQNFMDKFEGGFQELSIKINNKSPDTNLVGTHIRINLEQPLKPGESTSLDIEWTYALVEENAVRARNGYETFEDGNDIFLMAQWYPRVTVFSDYEGWHNKEFIGNGEFTLEFGDFEVDISVPSDHVVSATGVLLNEKDVLSPIQKKRMKQARKSEKPIFIITPDEAYDNELEKSTDYKTWSFKAENVRDFAWASSRKFIWDAAGYKQDSKENPLVMAMSFYPKEGEPLWSKYSTEAVMHTMKVYSKYSFDYPYPTAQSVNGPVGGMEYPMITFNGPRTEPEDDGTRTYSRSEKEFLIGVVIHEVGHIYYPMIVNSDERQWTWMDEGLNTFVQYLAEQEWDINYRSDRGEPRWMTEFMSSSYQVPIMTNSESLLQFGNNAYGKPATALVVLRETILGRELFDQAFREYSVRWKFKRPTPYDFFRTMEEASGVDLDWFWRGWFYSTDHVDIALNNIHLASLDTLDPQINLAKDRVDFENEPLILHDDRNETAMIETRVTKRPELLDIYDQYDEFTPSDREIKDSQEVLEDLYDRNDSDPEWKKKALVEAIEKDEGYYIFEFSNRGGLVMPIPLELTYEDGTKELIRIPVEVWRKNSKKTKWLKRSKLKITQAVIDPYWEIGDTQIENNYYPTRLIPARLKPRASRSNPKNLMQDLLKRNQVISSHN
ncbi:M1 family metallopeptidase [Gammaproteobacteria bacterium]|nr:M1 family metallopeptidase [Gammaproteobacteria bacterium]MDB4094562.1 M1 family metallopeptidase [Gammaproteobacteria bacterium]MDC0122784.1 M1 family metallopeptidase [Gammaproteobacteria bacterium]